MAATVYADASGNDHSEPLCLVAGLYNSVTNWSDFGREWRDFLNRRGIQYLHQTKSKEKANDEWKRDPTNRASVLDEAVQIIQRSGAIGLCFFTPTADYDGFIEHIESKDFKKPDCFAWNAFRFIVHVDGWCKNRRVKMPEFVFESSNRKEENALRRVMADYDLPEPIFRTKLDVDRARTVVALQAADFVAYELFKGWKQIMRAGIGSPPYIYETDRPYLGAFSRMEHSWGWADKEKMISLLPISASQRRLEAIVAERKARQGS